MNKSGRAPHLTLFSVLTMTLLLAGTAAGQNPAAAPEGKKHVITNDDLSSYSRSAPVSQSGDTQAVNPAGGTDSKADETAAANRPDRSDPAAVDDEMRKHQVGGPDPNEKPKDAIKRLEREESELRTKLDKFRDRAETEKDENRRRMWLEMVDHQQVTLQQMREERTALQKTEDKEGATGEADAGSSSETPAPEQQPPAPQ